MARWDSPLITVLWTEESPPLHQIWEAVTKGNVKPPNSGTLAVCASLYVDTDDYKIFRLQEHPQTLCTLWKKQPLLLFPLYWLSKPERVVDWTSQCLLHLERVSHCLRVPSHYLSYSG